MVFENVTSHASLRMRAPFPFSGCAVASCHVVSSPRPSLRGLALVHARRHPVHRLFNFSRTC
jgi:hypothetical protein